jgi:glycosyltransferase involved in cell wall biosynthesis
MTAAKPRVLVLVSPYGPTMRTDALANCAALSSKYAFRVLAPPQDVRAFSRAGIRATPWKPLGFIGVYLAIRRLRGAVKRFKPDVIHAHGFPAMSIALGTFPQALVVRTVASFHDPLRNRELPQKMVDARFPRYLGRGALLTCAYPTLAAALEKRFEMDPGTFAIVPHGVDGIDPAQPPLARPPGRAGPVVGWWGRLAPDPAWEVAIDALAEIRKTEPDARLIVAGDGPSRQFIAAHARQRGVGAAVEFRGRMAQAQFLAAIDMLLAPVTVDAQPEILLAALCDGVPVIAANGGAFKDALGAVETGWLVPDDAKGFAEGVRDAWSRIDAAWEGANAQRERARAAYARDVVVAATAAFYERITAGKSG